MTAARLEDARSPARVTAARLEDAQEPGARVTAGGRWVTAAGVEVDQELGSGDRGPPRWWPFGDRWVADGWPVGGRWVADGWPVGGRSVAVRWPFLSRHPR